MFTYKSVHLRPLEKNDLKHVMKWQNDYAVTRYTNVDAFIPRSYSEEEDWYARQLSSHGKMFFIILYKNAVVGYINFSGLDTKNKKAWIGIAIGEKNFQRKGIANKALHILESYLKKEMNIQKLKVQIISGNEPSINLFRKRGYFKEGEWKRDLYRDGKYHDILLYSKFL